MGPTAVRLVSSGLKWKADLYSGCLQSRYDPQLLIPNRYRSVQLRTSFVWQHRPYGLPLITARYGVGGDAARKGE